MKTDLAYSKDCPPFLEGLPSPAWENWKSRASRACYNRNWFRLSWIFAEFYRGKFRLFEYLEDSLLAFLQRRCKHPDEMVAVDILEGRGSEDMHVGYCRRCGAVRPEKDWRYIERHEPWRNPNYPHLWRG